MEMLTDLIKNICAFMLLTTVVNNLLQDSVYRKYIRLYVGVIVVILVINPVLSVFSMDMDFEKDVEKYMTSVGLNEMYDGIYNGEADAYEDIIAGYTEVLNATIEDIVGKYGLYIVRCDWEIETDYEKEFGKIYGLNLSLAYEDEVGYIMKDEIYTEIEAEFDIEKENINIEII